MITKTSQSGHTSYGVQEFVLDTPADIDDLPVSITAGSTAFIISTSQVYMLNSAGEWKEI